MQTKTKLSYNSVVIYLNTNIQQCRAIKFIIIITLRKVQHGKYYLQLYILQLIPKQKVLKTGVLHDAVHNYIQDENEKKNLIILFATHFDKNGMLFQGDDGKCCAES